MYKQLNRKSPVRVIYKVTKFVPITSRRVVSEVLLYEHKVITIT